MAKTLREIFIQSGLIDPADDELWEKLLAKVDQQDRPNLGILGQWFQDKGFKRSIKNRILITFLASDHFVIEGLWNWMPEYPDNIYKVPCFPVFYTVNKRTKSELQDLILILRLYSDFVNSNFQIINNFQKAIYGYGELQISLFKNQLTKLKGDLSNQLYTDFFKNMLRYKENGNQGGYHPLYLFQELLKSDVDLSVKKNADQFVRNLVIENEIGNNSPEMTLQEIYFSNIVKRDGLPACEELFESQLDFFLKQAANLSGLGIIDREDVSKLIWVNGKPLNQRVLRRFAKFVLQDHGEFTVETKTDYNCLYLLWSSLQRTPENSSVMIPIESLLGPGQRKIEQIEIMENERKAEKEQADAEFFKQFV